jgi:hypothetical protein
VSVDISIKKDLLHLCSSRRTRTHRFSPKVPTKWNPWEVMDDNGQPYTPEGAWEKIHVELQNGCFIKSISLDKPPGKTGYCFHFTDSAGRRVYVKLQIVSGQVHGRSFHLG